MVTILGNTKISDVKATFNSGAKVSYITLKIAIRLGLLITKNQSMALKIITKTISFRLKTVIEKCQSINQTSTIL